MTSVSPTWMRFMLVGVLLAVLAAVVLPAFAQDATPAPVATEQAATTSSDSASSSSGMLTGLRHLHSFVRWVVVFLTVALLVKLGLGLAQKSAFDAMTVRLQFWFSMGLTLQWVIGLLFLIVYGSVIGFGNLGRVWGHLTVMTVALGLSHMGSGKRFKAMDAAARHRNSLILVLVVLALVYVGVSMVGGW